MSRRERLGGGRVKGEQKRGEEKREEETEEKERKNPFENKWPRNAGKPCQLL